MPFWSTNHSNNAALNDPKRSFRFVVRFNGLSENTLWYAKTATKPSFQIASAEHKYLNHTFYYPGAVTWQDVSVTLVDPVDPDMAASLTDIVQAGGYVIPTPGNNSTMTKASASTALGVVTVSQIDSNGVALETWTLNNAFITEIKYGDLEYGKDDLTELSVTMKYDWATLEARGKSIRDKTTATGENNKFWSVGGGSTS
jgi:hypothetical protein